LSEPYATLVLFLFATGLRIGEAAALRWEVFDGDVFHVRRRIADGKLDSPKTRNSVMCEYQLPDDITEDD